MNLINTTPSFLVLISFFLFSLFYCELLRVRTGVGFGFVNGVFFKGDLEEGAFLKGVNLEEVGIIDFSIVGEAIGRCFVDEEDGADEECQSIISG